MIKEKRTWFWPLTRQYDIRHGRVDLVLFGADLAFLEGFEAESEKTEHGTQVAGPIR